MKQFNKEHRVLAVMKQFNKEHRVLAVMKQIKAVLSLMKQMARIVCALAVRGVSPVSWMYVVMCRLGPTGCNSSMS